MCMLEDCCRFMVKLSIPNHLHMLLLLIRRQMETRTKQNEIKKQNQCMLHHPHLLFLRLKPCHHHLLRHLQYLPQDLIDIHSQPLHNCVALRLPPLNHLNIPGETTGWSLRGVQFLLSWQQLLLCCRVKKVGTVRPWATGLSGQLQRAFVTGVPALKRCELEAACEDFSNIIGSTPSCMLYKGTLSSGVEIAVVSSSVTSVKDWSKECESHYRKKITSLSKVSHKNFMNLLGYCEEDEPFTRAMVFEYAPNGTLFEHLHVREAENLDWATRLRISMGIAYCLEHMQQLNPPVVPRNLDSGTIYLTDDLAAKVSDLDFWRDTGINGSDSSSATYDGDSEMVHRYGIILLEILTGKVGYSDEESLIDPCLGSFPEEEAARAVWEVARSCVDPEAKKRPGMMQVAARMKEITALGPEGATPKVSPLWWAELEIMSSQAS